MKVDRVELIVAVAVLLLSGGTNTLAVPTGSEPRGVAVNQITNRIYTANFSGGYDWPPINRDVTVIDGATNTVLTHVDLGNKLSIRVAVNAVSNRVYVINQRDRTVSVIDGQTNAVIDTITFEHSPTAVSVNEKTNRIYLTAYLSGSSYLHVINGVTNEVEASFTVPEPSSWAGPATGVAVHPAINRVYVGVTCESLCDTDQPDGGWLHVFDTTTNTWVGYVAFELGNYPGTNDVVVSAALARIYVQNARFLSIIDSTSITLLANLPIPEGGQANAMAYSSASKRVYLGGADIHGTRQMWVLDGTTDAFIPDELYAGDYPSGVAANPVTKRIFVTNHNRPSNVTVFFENELLRNPSFDGPTEDRIPDQWRPKNLTDLDAVDSYTRYEGLYSVRFVGTPGVTKRLSQTVRARGQAGTVVRFEALSQPAPAGCQPTGKAWEIKVEVRYLDGTSDAFALRFSSAPGVWQRKARRLVAGKSFDRLNVSLILADQPDCASVYFDALHLWRD